MKKHEIIKKVICEVLGVAQKEMFGRTRFKEYVQARHLYYYLSSKMTKVSLREISNLSNGLNPNHATVIHGIRSIKDSIDVDKPFAKKVNEIISLINMVYNADKELSKLKSVLYDAVKSELSLSELKELIKNIHYEYNVQPHSEELAKKRAIISQVDE